MGSQEIIVSALLDGMRSRGQSLAVAESLTGGLLSSHLIDVPGASDVFRAGIVAYQNSQKVRLLGVDPELIAQHGAVSEQVARAMALGVCQRSGADWGIATTGVAGPDSSEGKPVGTVWVACIRSEPPTGEEESRAELLNLCGSRSAIRFQSVNAALVMALAVVEGHPRPHPGARGTV